MLWLDRPANSFKHSGTRDQSSGSFWAESVQILVILNPAGYMLTSSRFALFIWVYSIDSSKMIGDSPEVSNFNWLFLKLNQFICN